MLVEAFGGTCGEQFWGEEVAAAIVKLQQVFLGLFEGDCDLYMVCTRLPISWA